MTSLPQTVPVAPEAETAFGYHPRPGVRDEMVDAAGVVRPHWRGFLQRLSAMSPALRARSWQEARQLIHDNGVSYNVYGDPRGLERPWSLEPLPVLLSASEWTPLAAAVAQRARLLDRVLADLYGPQRALREGWLPAELLFAHPGFLRAVHGAAVPRGRWLPFYAADVARGPDGAWRALADRTQSPAGAGYALENRVVTSRALPELFREGNVERLAMFFRRVQETLAELAAPAQLSLRSERSPRVVLLTAGPYNATYFEQAYLAQYLGYTLSTGRDLTVRGDRLYLKSLAGLQAVDVILRRVNDDYCDPLELRAESVLGVPGLTDVARQGNVVVANPLGTGLVQTSALLPYLPALCRHLLDEELKLPSVDTFWAGDPGARAQLLARFDRLVLKPAFPDGVTQPVFVSRLAAEQRAEWQRRILAEPSRWVAQEELAASTAPVLVGPDGEAVGEDPGQAGLAPRTLVLRTFAVTGLGEPMVMPGALARVAGSADNPEVSMQAGSGSKDAWVLADAPVEPFSLLPPPSHPVTLTRGSGDLPSQTADNLFWLGRYAERAEGIARLARVLLRLLEEGPAEADRAGSTWAEPTELLRTLAAFADPGGAPPPIPLAPGRQGALQTVLEAIFDRRRSSSLVAVNHQVITVARLVRDRLSADSWRVLAALVDELSPDPYGDPGPGGAGAADTSSPALMATLDRTVLVLAAFSGIAHESMTRSHAWRFLDIGRRLERAIGLVRLLRHTLVEPADRPQALLEAVLEVADSGITYRRRYLATLQGAPVLDLLLVDGGNPRGLVFQLEALSEHWQVLGLPGLSAPGGDAPDPAPLLAALRALDVEALAALDERRRRPALDALLTRLGMALPALSQLLSAGYLSHATVSRHLGAQCP
jgi:uncharacterized circularly permuted ATP-grasp superfamily protein/uncharacterized alpha-E superfamily protein